MSHLDEGTLHALLDGELDAKEVREIQAHLGSCSACGTRLQSVKEVAAETDRLVGVIQFPGTPRRPAALDPAPEPVRHITPRPVAEPEPEYGREAEFEAPPAYQPPSPIESAETPAAPRPRPAERRIGAEPVYHEAPPVLLVPDDNAWGERRRRVVLLGRWAALVFVAVGAGYIASEVRKTGAPVPTAPAARLNDEQAPVLSSAEETSRPESTITSARQAAPAAASQAAPAPARLAAPKTTPAPAAKPANLAQNTSTPSPDRTDKVSAVGALGAADAAGFDETQDSEPAATDEDPVPPPDVREEAAEAMEELDRERRLERAAAATAALDREAKRRATVSRAAAAPAPTPPPAPAPRTLEQRSNVYLRIGLDEAARQLGRPVHVIEGMQQQFMGLAQGVASPAADATRPVVRVVYQDNQGRMILLDQQRIRPGQAWNSTETRWVVGEIGLALLGEPGPEILRNLRPRVR